MFIGDILGPCGGALIGLCCTGDELELNGGKLLCCADEGWDAL